MIKTFKSFLNEQNENNLLESALHGSISGSESYKAISHFKHYVAPYLKKDEIKKAKKHIEKFGDASKIEEKDGEKSDEKHSHELNSRTVDHDKGTKIKVHGIHHIENSGRIHLNTSHGIIPQSKLKKPESLQREQKSKTGFDVEHIISKNLGTKSAGSTGHAYDFYYGKDNKGKDVVRGKTKVVNEHKKALKTHEKPTVTGESKLTNVKMGAGSLKWNKDTKKWTVHSKLHHFKEHIEKHATVTHNGKTLPLLHHMNKYHSNGTVDKGFSTDAPKGTSRSYFKSNGANVLHIHNKETNKGTSFTIGNNNELKGKTKLHHLSDSHMDHHFDGKLNIEKTKVGSAALYHRPKEKNMEHLSNLSASDKNHRDLTNPQHAGEFKRHIDNHIRSLSK